MPQTTSIRDGFVYGRLPPFAELS